MVEREEVISRLQAGNRGLQLSSDARRTHIDAMADLLEQEQPAKPGRLVRAAPGRTMAALAMACLLGFGLTTAAAAYSNAMPGDLFYGVKRAAEQPMRLFDGDIMADNRLDELAAMIEAEMTPAEILAARDDAGAELSGRSQDDDLLQAFRLLAWPDPRRLEKSDDGVIVADADWGPGYRYVASLPDGHLVTVSWKAGQVEVSTTGTWDVSATGPGWQVADGAGRPFYQLRRDGDRLVITPQPQSGGSTPAEAAETGGDPESDRDDDEWSAGPIDGPETSLGGSEPSAGGVPSEPTGGFNRGGLERVTARPGSATETTTAPTAGSQTTTAQTPGGGPDRSTGSPGPTTGRTTATTTVTTTQRVTTTRAVTTARGVTTTRRVTTTSRSTTSRPPTTIPPTTVPTTTPTTRRSTTAPPATTVPTTNPTTMQTTQPPAPISLTAYLRNPGGGNTSSSRSLTMSDGAGPTGSLANYDTNRDGDPGLMIQKDGAGVSTSDSTKYQEWRWTATQDAVLAGSVDLRIWLAAKDFKTDETIGLQAALDV